MIDSSAEIAKPNNSVPSAQSAKSVIQTKRYPEYKDSGVEWVGVIPQHWSMSKLKFHARKIIDGAHFTPTYVEDSDAVPFLRVTDLHFKEIILEDVKKIPRNEHIELIKRCNPEKGDLLLSKNGTIGLMKIVDWDWEFSVFVSLCLIKFKYTLLNSFFFYFFRSNVVERQLFESSQKTSVTNLHLEKIKELRLTLPPPQEQTLIANYLDHRTTQIDDLIRKKERLIQLLEEERTAIINQAVTKGLPSEERIKAGLDLDVPMKDSGIEWLGEIPAHWEVKKLKHVAYLKSGESITSEQISEEGEFPVYGGNGIRGYSPNYTNTGNYVLIGRQGALCGNIKFASGRFWASEHAIVSYLYGENNWLWFGKLLDIMNLNQYSQSAAQPGLSVREIESLFLPVPPVKEQRDIAKYIESQVRLNELIISKANNEIELLKEYKTALISEVVTGKIDVRDEVLD